ncbi:Beta-lactamase class C and other penicillin binding proteins [Actinomycetales bacterium JB111]|nr:Beta-lactamase class C and other penicillin binding proteins [Actinomycetales bacterium JB111]
MADGDPAPRTPTSRAEHEALAARVAAAMRSATDRMPTIAAGAVWGLSSGSAAARHRTVAATEPLTADSLLLTASVMKLLTAALVHSLADDGTLGLDDPVERHVPEWAGRCVLARPHGPIDATVPASRSFTVRDLLLMGFGLGYDADAPGGDPLSQATEQAEVFSSWVPPHLAPDEWARRVATLPAAHQPGEGWLYQTSFDALTVVVERATGRGFDDELADRLLVPLGMRDTGFTVPESALARVPAHVFPGEPGPVVALPAGAPSLTERPAFCSGATGLVSTVADLLAFGEMILDDGVGPSGRVLTPAAVRAMSTPAIGPAAARRAGDFLPDGTSWSLGCGVDARGRLTWAGGTGTNIVIDPARKRVAVLLTRYGMGEGQPDHMAAFETAIDDDA